MTETLAEARHRLHLTQLELAQALGISRRQVQAYEMGEKDPPPYIGLAMRTLLSEREADG